MKKKNDLRNRLQTGIIHFNSRIKKGGFFLGIVMFRNRNHNAHEIDFNCICMHGLIQLVGVFLD